jgi:hypothetical protein
MTTCRDIITYALQRTGIVALGRDPKANEAANGLIVLQGMYDDMIAAGTLGELTDVYKTADYTAKEFERIYADGATITLPDLITDDGDTRHPRDLAVIAVNDGTLKTYVWENSWTALFGLTLDSDAPFATRGKDGLACWLASNWVDTFGGEVSNAVLTRGRRFHSILLGANATASEQVEYY